MYSQLLILTTGRDQYGVRRHEYSLQSDLSGLPRTRIPIMKPRKIYAVCYACSARTPRSMLNTTGEAKTRKLIIRSTRVAPLRPGNCVQRSQVWGTPCKTQALRVCEMQLAAICDLVGQTWMRVTFFSGPEHFFQQELLGIVRSRL